MAEILTIDREITWSGEMGQHPTVNIDGVIVILDGEGIEYYVPFRAEDKGGSRLDKEPYVWEWDNPEDPIGDVTLNQTITLETEENGEITNGEWIGD